MCTRGNTAAANVTAITDTIIGFEADASTNAVAGALGVVQVRHSERQRKD